MSVSPFLRAQFSTSSPCAAGPSVAAGDEGDGCPPPACTVEITTATPARRRKNSFMSDFPSRKSDRATLQNLRWRGLLFREIGIERYHVNLIVSKRDYRRQNA